MRSKRLGGAHDAPPTPACRDRELGARFRAARETWGLSAASAAAVLGVEPSWLAALEDGRATISSVDLVRLAHGYSRGPEDLFAEPFDPAGPLAAIPAAELAELERTVDALAEMVEEAVPAEVPVDLFNVVGKR